MFFLIRNDTRNREVMETTKTDFRKKGTDEKNFRKKKEKEEERIFFYKKKKKMGKTKGVETTNH